MMSEDSTTKDAFREMDGFLCLMNIFSTLQPTTTDNNGLGDVQDTLLFAFRILSQALSGHPANRAAFEVLDLHLT